MHATNFNFVNNFWNTGPRALIFRPTGLDKFFLRKTVNIFLPIIFNICFGCSKEPSHWYDSFEYPQHMYWLRNKKIHFCYALSTKENLSWGFANKRCRPACTSVQSDQHLCYLLIGKYPIETCYKQNLNFPASFCSWAGWFGYELFGNP